MGDVALLFHGIEHPAEAFTTVRAVFLTGCLAGLRDRSVQGCSLRAYSVMPVHEPAVVLTFDDGCASDYTIAAPLLSEYAMTATFFITTAHLDRPGFVSRAWVREMAAAGMEIGSHGVAHRYLTRLCNDEVRHELSASKAALEDILGAPVDSFSFPGGAYNARVVAAALESGYRRLATSRPGTSPGSATVVRRCAVDRYTALAEVEPLLAGAFGPLLRRQIAYQVRAVLKTAIGIENYARLKRWVLGSVDDRPLV